MKKIFIACGGTGGHLAPGIALAEELTKRGWHCHLLISNKQVDSRLVQKYQDFTYESLSGRGLSLKPISFLKFLGSLFRGTAHCYRLIGKERPDCVIGFGGFLSMPALLAAWLRAVPSAIHEANQVAGRVTRLSGRFVSRLYLPEGVSVGSGRADRVLFVGMPVRSEIRPVPREEAKRALGLDPQQTLLLVMGGSQGAQALNEWLKKSLPALAEEEIQSFCLTGSAADGEGPVSLKSPAGKEVKSVFRRFSDDMATVLSAADICISRSGAGSIAELIRCGVPSILLPYPFSADDHQFYNAQKFEEKGYGIAMDQQNIEELLQKVRRLLQEQEQLDAFRSNMERHSQIDVAAFMADDLERSFLRKSSPSRVSVTGKS